MNLFIKKFISFIFIDINSSNPNYYNPLHYLPLLILSITSIIGIMMSDKKSNKLNILIILFFANIAIFSCFFILPRYKLVIIPLQIIFTNIFIDFIRKKFCESKIADFKIPCHILGRSPKYHNLNNKFYKKNNLVHNYRRGKYKINFKFTGFDKIKYINIFFTTSINNYSYIFVDQFCIPLIIPLSPDLKKF